MNAEIRDALPDLLHGRLSEMDATVLREHVESCADCKAELALLREFRAVSALAPRIDVERVVAALPSPVPSAASFPAARTGRQNYRTLGLVAAAAIVAFAGWEVSGYLGDRTSGESVSVASGDKGVGSPDVSVAPPAPVSQDAMPPAGAAPTSPESMVASLSLVGATQDLTDTELETLLTELDQVESLPSAEPQPVTLSVEDLEDGQ